MNIVFRKLNEEAKAPTKAYINDAGWDIYAMGKHRIPPGGRKLIGSGIVLKIPEGHYGAVHPRSGLAHKHGVTVLNSPGTIDSDYTGELLVNLINLDQWSEYNVSPGDRIAQLLIHKVEPVVFVEVGNIDPVNRGVSGHGSSGN